VQESEIACGPRSATGGETPELVQAVGPLQPHLNN